MASSWKNNSFNNIRDSEQILQPISKYNKFESDTMRAVIQN